MKKFILFISLALCTLLVLSFTACNIGHNENTNSQTETNTNTTNTNTGSIESNTNTNNTVCTEHSFDNWTVSKKPNCAGIGEEKSTCTICGVTQTRETQSETKGNCEYTLWATALSAGCTEEGISARICKNCGDIQTKKISKIEHTEEDWNTTTPATCLEDGIDTCNCRCAQTKVVKALGHNIEIAGGVAPTEEHNGTTVYWTCTRCYIEGGDNSVGKLSEVTNVASLGKYSHNATDFWAFDPKLLYDGKENHGTRSPKGGDYSIFVDYDYQYYVTSFKLKCNGGGSLSSGSTDLVYAIKNISINFYDVTGKMIYTTGKTDVSANEYVECTVNNFVSRIEIQIFDGSHRGEEFLWELYVMAPPTLIKEK